jgi:hypothetical protein
MPKKKAIHSKTDLQAETLPLDLLHAQLDDLSPRSRNVMGTYLKGDEDNTLKWLPLFDQDFPFTSIQKCGVISQVELRAFFKNLEKELLQLQAGDVQDRAWSLFMISTCRKYGISVPVSITYSPLLLVDTILSKSDTFSATYRQTMKEMLAIYTDHPKRLTDLTTEFAVTNERVRQVRESLVKKIAKVLAWFRDHRLAFVQMPVPSGSLVIVDDALRNKLNREYGVSFSRQFMAWCIAQLDQRFSLLGVVEDVLFSSLAKHSFRHNWQYIYALSNQFPVDKIAKTIEALDGHVRSRREMRSTLSIRDFMPKDVAAKAADPEWNAVLKTLLHREFDLDLLADGTFKLFPNSHRHLAEYFYDILSERKKRTSGSDIVDILSEQYPEVKCNKSSVGALTWCDDRFVNYGKKIYGLAEWHKGELWLRKGTIRDFAYEYLKKKNMPVSYTELTQYILPLRPTSSHWSIINNLKIAEDHDFLVRDGFVSFRKPRKNKGDN